MMRWQDFRAFHHEATADTSQWSARGSCVYGLDNTLIAQCRNAEVASSIVRFHNDLPAVCNLTVWLYRKWADLRSLKNEG